MRVGVLTGGGDCPGLNAIIRAIVIRGEEDLGHNIVGFRHGWRGVMECDAIDLTTADTRGILQLGGTILGTSRSHPSERPDGVEQVMDTIVREHIDALIVIGGDGTLAASQAVIAAGANVVGVPKTIDNDVMSTDASVGFDTAVAIATEAVDRVRTTAESHDRVIVVEVMGHTVGWIAAAAGIAGGAHIVLIPEEPFELDEVCARIQHRHRRGSHASVVVVAEGAMSGDAVRDEIVERTGFDTRLVVLGHTQRGGPPTAADRLLGSRFGLAAIEAVHEGAFGVVVALQDGRIVRVPFADAVGGLKVVDDELRAAIRVLAR